MKKIIALVAMITISISASATEVCRVTVSSSVAGFASVYLTTTANCTGAAPIQNKSVKLPYDAADTKEALAILEKERLGVIEKMENSGFELRASSSLSTIYDILTFVKKN